MSVRNFRKPNPSNRNYTIPNIFDITQTLKQSSANVAKINNTKSSNTALNSKNQKLMLLADDSLMSSEDEELIKQQTDPSHNQWGVNGEPRGRAQ